MNDSLTRTRIEILLIFVLYLFILPRSYMDFDMGFWREWALTIHKYGIGGAYSHGINYLPVYLYGIYIYDLLQGTEANIIHNINNIKILFVCFDFLPLFVLACFRQRILTYKIPHLYLLLNIAYVFNSMVWGQMDSMYANLSFLAILITIIYPITGILLYLVALNTKQQAIEFLPIMGIVSFFSIRKWKTILIAVGAAFVLELLILMPFLNNGGITQIGHIITNTVGLYHQLSICAFNIWYIIVPENPYFIDDSSIYFLFSYRVIGLSLFAISSAFLLVPLFSHIYQLRKQLAIFNDNSYRLLMLATGLICLYFFYFNSQMHERYANPIIICFFFYGVVSKNYKLYALASIPYFLSLDKCFPDYLPIVHYKIIFASRVIAIWYTLTVIYGSYLYYKECKSQVLLPKISTSKG